MIIHLISSPRNVSTALMYSFAQRRDTKVIDEPFYGYYLNRFDVDHPAKKDIITHMECDFEKIVAQITALQSAHTHVFVKNMAHHLIDARLQFLSEYHNILFIRHPSAIISSFAKVISSPTLQDIGVQQQVFLFDALTHICKTAPIVVDSADLIMNPEALLTKLCEKIGIPFSSTMLHWNKGGIPEDGVWAQHWYANVHNSTGFLPKKSSDEAFPEHCKPLLEEALPYYQILQQHSLKM